MGTRGAHRWHRDAVCVPADWWDRAVLRPYLGGHFASARAAYPPLGATARTRELVALRCPLSARVHNAQSHAEFRLGVVFFPALDGGSLLIDDRARFEPSIEVVVVDVGDTVPMLRGGGFEDFQPLSEGTVAR